MPQPVTSSQLSAVHSSKSSHESGMPRVQMSAVQVSTVVQTDRQGLQPGKPSESGFFQTDSRTAGRVETGRTELRRVDAFKQFCTVQVAVHERLATVAMVWAG